MSKENRSDLTGDAAGRKAFYETSIDPTLFSSGAERQGRLVAGCVALAFGRGRSQGSIYRSLRCGLRL